MNFKDDLKREIKTYFDSWEISYTVPTDERDALIDFFNTNLKLINQRPRQVFKSDDVIRKSQGQPYATALTYIENKFINGGDLNPHLSKRSLKPDFDDRLLNDWAIYHIHISDTKRNSSQKFYDRSDFLLFALAFKDAAYFIDIRPHDEQLVFSRQELLTIVHRNWIHLLEPLELKGVIALEHNSTDEDIDKLRTTGVNVAAYEIAGKIYGTWGFGYTTNGKSVQSVMRTNDILKWIRRAEKYITEHADELKEKISTATGTTVENPDYEIKIIEDSPGFVIVEKTTNCYCA